MYAPQRQKIIKKLNGDTSYENIYNECKKKGHTNAKAEEITKTIVAYLQRSGFETSNEVCCDARTVYRRINEFLKDDEEE